MPARPKDVVNFFFFSLFLGVVFCENLYAGNTYPFKGRLDLEHQTFHVWMKMPHEAALNVDVTRQDQNVLKTVIDIQKLRTPFFEMTTEIQSVVDVHRQDGRFRGLSGRFESRYSLIDHQSVPEIQGRFDLKGGRLFLDDLVAGDFHGQGAIDMEAPYRLEAKIGFERLELSAFLDWLTGQGRKFSATGELSGHIALGGTPQRLSVKSQIVSEAGWIENFPYERMVLHLDGIYPVMDLANSTITKSTGFSFDLAGTVDLSDKERMEAQIQALQKIPLVNDNHLQSEWVLKRIKDVNADGNETKYFIKKDKNAAMSGHGEVDDFSVFGVERKIGF